MHGMTRWIAGALLTAAMTGGALAQTSAAQGNSNGVYGLLPNNPPPTDAERAANAETTIVIHFISDVSYWSALQLVVMVQDYYRDGYRKFVMPIQTVGGSVSSAMYAYETLSRMPIEFSTVAMGGVDSAGIYLYCIGQKRYVTPGASFLFHPMSGTVNSNRRGQDAAERQIESLNAWTEGVNKACFGETPEEWDLERRDYRLLADEAAKVGLVNAEGNYFEAVEPIGGVSYIYPMFFPQAANGAR